MKSPHLLLICNNVQKITRNLEYILDQTAMSALQDEVAKNVRSLYQLGLEHHAFAKRQPAHDWRQVVSRLYYGAFNVSRAVRLQHSGDYSQESSDHDKVKQHPPDFPERAAYSVELPALRQDRNVCDYDHSAQELDLLKTPAEWETLVASYLGHAKQYLVERGVTL